MFNKKIEIYCCNGRFLVTGNHLFEMVPGTLYELFDKILNPSINVDELEEKIKLRKTFVIPEISRHPFEYSERETDVPFGWYFRGQSVNFYLHYEIE